MQSNTVYFEISKISLETLDPRYMFLDKAADLNRYIDCSRNIHRLLTAIASGDVSDKNLRALHTLICSDFSAGSELGCFINACDSTLATIRDDFNTFKEIVSLYLENRDIPEHISPEMIQAVIDKGASRSKGKIGERKLIQTAIEHGFVECHSWDDFLRNTKTVAACSKDVFNNQNIFRHLKVDLNFGAQNKLLDVLIKNGNNLTFIEAKHLKEGGGSQDKQIKELIEILRIDNSHSNVFIGAFLDGVYSNTLLDIPAEIENTRIYNNKTAEQQRDILQALRASPRAYWLNTAGYEAFIADFARL